MILDDSRHRQPSAAPDGGMAPKAKAKAQALAQITTQTTVFKSRAAYERRLRHEGWSSEGIPVQIEFARRFLPTGEVVYEHTERTSERIIVRTVVEELP